MLDTLLKIGKWQSHGKSEWERFIDIPKVEGEDKKGNPITNYTFPIVFDLDKNEVIVESNYLKEFDEKVFRHGLCKRTFRGNIPIAVLEIISIGISFNNALFLVKEKDN